MKNILLLLLVVLVVSACRKDDVQTEEKGTATVEYEFVFGMNETPFSLNQLFVHPMTSDSLTFNVFKFYVSNVQLQKSDGTWWEVPESYHLICLDCANPVKTIELKDIPTGDYKAMKYTLGVDSTRNVSGAQTGALDPANGLYWDWNSGYIMLMAEGTSPQSTTGTFAFHLGGFSGDFDIVTPREATFGSTLNITTTSNTKVKFKANVAKLWHNGASVSVVNRGHMPNATTTPMAKNFFDAIYFSGLE